MAYCNSCGTKMNSDEPFCKKCGESNPAYKPTDNESDIKNLKKMGEDANNKYPASEVNAKKDKPKDSALSIAAVILSLFTFTAPIAIIIALIDLKKNDGKRKLGSKFAICISLIFIIVSVISYKNKGNTDTISATTNQTGMSKTEFMNDCSSFDYKTVARNPESYVNKNYVVILNVISSEKVGDIYAYKCFDNNLNLIYVFDYQDKNDSNYINVLEKDTIKCYGTFTGMIDTVNTLNGSKSEAVALNMYYCYIQ